MIWTSDRPLKIFVGLLDIRAALGLFMTLLTRPEQRDQSDSTSGRGISLSSSRPSRLWIAFVIGAAELESPK